MGITGVLPQAGPARTLAIATFVNTVGNGLFMTVSAIFFTRSVGLSVREVGIGLTIAAAAGLVVSAPIGHLADRWGPREVLIALALSQAVTAVALVVVHSFWMFVLIVSVGGMVDRGASAARGAVIAGALPADGRVRARAYLRAVTNVGISLGAVGAGAALHVDTRAGYVAVILVDAVSFVLAAAVLTRIPHLAPLAVPEGARGGLAALRDRPFVVYSLVNGILAIHYGLLEVAVPLWVVLRTDAPRWVVAALFLVNTAMVVLFQVRLSRGTDDLRYAARVQVRSGVLLAVACVLFALAGGRSAWVATAVLIAAAFVHVLGELWQAAGSWGLSFGLAPAHAQGQYQGVFNAGWGLGNMLAPLVVTALAVEWGTPGWLVLGATFVIAGALVPPVARWAERSRPALALAPT